MIVQKIILKKGWNLVSFNLFNVDFNKVIQEQRVLEIKSSERFYNSSVPKIFNTLNSLDPELGYFIKSSEDFELNYEGYNVDIEKLDLIDAENLITSYYSFIDDKVNLLFTNERLLYIDVDNFSESTMSSDFMRIVYQVYYNSDKSIAYLLSEPDKVMMGKDRYDIEDGKFVDVTPYFKTRLEGKFSKYLKLFRISDKEYIYETTPETLYYNDIFLTHTMDSGTKLTWPRMKFTFSDEFSGVYTSEGELDSQNNFLSRGNFEIHSPERKLKEKRLKEEAERNKLIDYLTKKYTSKLENITTVNFSKTNIKNTDLIYQLINIENLIFFDTKVEKIDLSKNLKLKTISSARTLLKKLDFSANKNIENIYVMQNEELEEMKRKFAIHNFADAQKRLASIKAERKELRTKLDQFQKNFE